MGGSSLNACGRTASVSWAVLMYLRGCWQLLKGKPGGFMERITFKVDTGEGCVCRVSSSDESWIA
eukprot:1143532-Pelagomonas_calceolata.AAC.2